MAILDFKEIPEAHIASGEQDQFELFARDFLEMLGFEILRSPSRGADGGLDLLVEETRAGIAGKTKIKWLVSCKHKAHSGSSVGTDAETNILDRVKSHGCEGFIGFYSTLPSSGLSSMLDRLQKNENIEITTYDAMRIENDLLTSPRGVVLARRYFPISFQKWQHEHPIPANLLRKTEGLKCAYCENPLFPRNQDGTYEYSGNLIFWWQDEEDTEITTWLDVYWVHKRCTNPLEAQYRGLYPEAYDSWEELYTLKTPTIYIEFALSIINVLWNGRNKFTEKAIQNLLTFLYEMSPYISRELTESEKRYLKLMSNFPSYLGGISNIIDESE